MNTLYELALRSKPAIVIPIPQSVQTEQTQNAKFFAKAGLGDYMSQGETTDQVFLHHLASVMKNLDKYQTSQKSHQEFLSDGASRLAQIVLAAKNNV
jgi:UDP-N-acetylglucosamine:LPS N-acetylglucosamine transferase